MSQQNQTESKPRSFRDGLLIGLAELGVQGGCLLVLAVCAALPFMPTWLQIAVILSPLLVWALVLWRREQKRQW